MKPVAESCLRNQQPIADALSPYLKPDDAWLELGSGTGQHGVFIAGRHPPVTWQLTDTAAMLAGMRAWQTEAQLPNLPLPLALDVTRDQPPADNYAGVFTANTVHFVGWPVVQSLVRCAAHALRPEGYLVIYGPFNRDGSYTSAGNASLDRWLRERDPGSGIKDRADVVELAARFGLTLTADVAMPANNQLLVFQKTLTGSR